MRELRVIGAYVREARSRSRLSAWLRVCIASLLARRAARHTVGSLEMLSDRELRDIGLLRAEIGEVAAARCHSRRADRHEVRGAAIGGSRISRTALSANPAAPSSMTTW